MIDLNQFMENYRKSKDDRDAVAFPVKKVRDLTVIELFHDVHLVVACDSDGAIGTKLHDVVKCPNYVLGRFAARVPLLEILCCGAVPIVVVDALSVEMNPTGKEIISGIRDEAYAAGVRSADMITGSTEDNIPTSQTGVGVVVIGFVREADFKPGKSLTGDAVISIGLPKSGPTDLVKLDDPEIVHLHTLLNLVQIDFVHDIVPVGSKGIFYEAQALAATASKNFQVAQDVPLNLSKSAGPSTCVLASLTESELKQLKKITPHPIHLIGHLE